MLASFDVNGDLLLRVEKTDAAYMRAATAFARHVQARGLLNASHTDLLEHGKSGVFTDTRGYKYRLQDGVHVPLNAEEEKPLRQFLAELDGEQVEVVQQDKKLGLVKVKNADGEEKVVKKDNLKIDQTKDKETPTIQGGDKAAENAPPPAPQAQAPPVPPAPPPPADETPARVLFEVAPDPNDKELTAKWKAVSDSRRLEISRGVAAQIMPKAFALAGVKAELTEQFGGYLNDTNPSFAALVPDAYSVKQLMDVAKLGGFALSQDSMMVVRNKPFEGADKVGFITVHLPADSDINAVHGVFQKLRKIDNGIVQGHTTVKGEMLIVDYSGKSEELQKKIFDALGGEINVNVGEGYAAFPQKKDYDYGREDGQGASELAGRRADANRLRGEASEAIRTELDRGEAGAGTPGSGPGAAGQPAGPKPDGGPGQAAGGGVADLHAPITKEKITAPPPSQAEAPLYEPDPTKDSTGNGVADASRVGVPADQVPPPPPIGRLPRLTKNERLVESRFADKFQNDPQAMIDAYNAGKNKQIGVDKNGQPKYEIGDAPNIFNTDDAKMLSDVYNPPADAGVSPEDVLAMRSRYNTVLHQTANAIAKKAFLDYLDKLPADNKTVLVTSGGVAAGKGYALGRVEAVNNVAKQAGCVWDAAGEQNATENTWIMDECAKRGIKPTFLYVHSDPQQTWENPKRGVVERAGKIGRMVDARLFADSYTLGAKNFAAFHQANKDKAQFFILDNTDSGKDKDGNPTNVPEVPPAALAIDSDALYHRCVGFLQNSESVNPAVKRGGLNGLRVWPETHNQVKESRERERGRGRDLLEAAGEDGFTGEITDKIGRHVHFVNGVRIKWLHDKHGNVKDKVNHPISPTIGGEPVKLLAHDVKSGRVQVRLASGEVVVVGVRDIDFGGKQEKRPDALKPPAPPAAAPAASSPQAEPKGNPSLDELRALSDEKLVQELHAIGLDGIIDQLQRDVISTEDAAAVLYGAQQNRRGRNTVAAPNEGRRADKLAAKPPAAAPAATPAKPPAAAPPTASPTTRPFHGSPRFTGELRDAQGLRRFYVNGVPVATEEGARQAADAGGDDYEVVKVAAPLTTAQADERANKLHDLLRFVNIAPPEGLKAEDLAAWQSNTARQNEIVRASVISASRNPRDPANAALNTEFVRLRDERSALVKPDLHATQAAPTEEPAKEEADDWDGSINDSEVDEGDYDFLDDWSTWELNDDGDAYDSTTHQIEIQSGKFTPEGRDEPVDVYRWLSNSDDNTDDIGEWTTDESEAKRDGQRYARRNNQPEPEPPEPEGGDFEDEDVEAIFNKGGDLGLDVEQNGAEVNLNHEKIDSCQRTLMEDSRGKYIHNDNLFLKDEFMGDGFGAEVFFAEVEGAREAGFDFIETYAARNDARHHPMNGYYTWLTLGYNQSIADLKRQGNTILAQRIQQLVPGATTMQDMFAYEKPVSFTDEENSEIRRKILALAALREEQPKIKEMLEAKAARKQFTMKEWWLANGVGLHNMVFKLNDDSRSMKIYQEVLAKKRAKVKPKT